MAWVIRQNINPKWYFLRSFAPTTTFQHTFENTTLFLKCFHWKFGKQTLKKNGTIIHHDFFHAILQCTLESTLLQSKTERHIVEGMLKNCPRLENLIFLYIIYITLR